MTQSNFVEVAKLSDVPDRGTYCIRVEGQDVILCNSDGQIYAIESECSHASQSLECGIVRMGWIACPAHGARFDLETGEPLGPPATTAIRTYPVQVKHGSISIDISRIA